MIIEYKVIYSGRRTVGLEIKPDGQVLVRAPMRMSREDIRRFVADHEQWIVRHREIVRQRTADADEADRLTMEDIRRLADEAMKVIPKRVAYYAPKVGVNYGRITIRNQRSRWGSCSAKGNLNFNCLLMLAPPEVLDSVVVHELCHRIEMNHSERFYKEVLRVFPDYWKWDRWLKENGNRLMRRMRV